MDPITQFLLIHLCQWCLKHSKLGVVLSQRDVDKYYREFTALSWGFAPSHILETETSLCFYRGIPAALHMKIKKQILAANLKTLSLLGSIPFPLARIKTRSIFSIDTTCRYVWMV